MKRQGLTVMHKDGETEELRNHPRYRVDLRLKVITGIADGNRAVFGRGSDISEGGLRVFVPADLAVGGEVTLELTLPYSDQKLTVRGILRNRLGFSYGVEYSSSTTLSERQAVARACKALSLVQ